MGRGGGGGGDYLGKSQLPPPLADMFVGKKSGASNGHPSDPVIWGRALVHEHPQRFICVGQRTSP